MNSWESLCWTTLQNQHVKTKKISARATDHEKPAWKLQFWWQCKDAFQRLSWHQQLLQNSHRLLPRCRQTPPEQSQTPSQMPSDSTRTVPSRIHGGDWEQILHDLYSYLFPFHNERRLKWRLKSVICENFAVSENVTYCLKNVDYNFSLTLIQIHTKPFNVAIQEFCKCSESS